jgi:hypothetical protein
MPKLEIPEVNWQGINVHGEQYISCKDLVLWLTKIELETVRENANVHAEMVGIIRKTIEDLQLV